LVSLLGEGKANRVLDPVVEVGALRRVADGKFGSHPDVAAYLERIQETLDPFSLAGSSWRRALRGPA
jgi:hypothetical protein